MARSFNNTDSANLINAFGEDLVLTNGKIIKVIFEQENITIAGDEFTTIQQTYFSTTSDSITFSDTFTLDSQLYSITEIIDDRSGVIDCYYHASEE